MNRRLVIGAGAGLAAAALGAGVALRRQAASSSATDAGDLLTARLERPEGGLLEMASLRGRPLLLNFWATWCAPCVREMPLIDRFHRAQAERGWQVVGLAIDQPEAVRAFLGRMPISYPVGLAAAAGLTWARRLGDESGALPFTVVVEPDGSIGRRKLGTLEPGELESWSRRLG